MTGDALVCTIEAPRPCPTSGGSCGEPETWLWPSRGNPAASRRGPCAPEARRAGSESLGLGALVAKAPLSRGGGPSSGCGGPPASCPSASPSRVRGAGPAWTSTCSSSAQPPSSPTPGGRGEMEGWAASPPGRGRAVKMLLTRAPSLGTSGSPPGSSTGPLPRGLGPSLSGLPEPCSAPCRGWGPLRVLGAFPGVVEGVAASGRGLGLAVVGPVLPYRRQPGKHCPFLGRVWPQAAQPGPGGGGRGWRTGSSWMTEATWQGVPGP